MEKEDDSRHNHSQLLLLLRSYRGYYDVVYDGELRRTSSHYLIVGISGGVDRSSTLALLVLGSASQIDEMARA